ncbi:MAG: M23 family metallopeptidase [Synechococcaceae cyanobacterium]|nr:M23 family metallopeptidase [Synechococcaceae cyanobacterium]
MASKPLPLLLALGALLGAPFAGVRLALAQAEAEAPPVPATLTPPPAPQPPPTRLAPQPAVESAPKPLAVDSAPHRITAPEPASQPREPVRRFDAIVEQRLYRPQPTLSPSDYARPGGNVRMTGPAPDSSRSIAQLCAEGAVEAYRCRGAESYAGLAGPGAAPSAAGGAPGVSFEGSSLASALGSPGSDGGRRFGIDAAPLPPISVPVTALLSGSGGNFRLTDVFRVTPRPRAIAGNGNSRLLFPLIGSAVTTSNFGWRLHPVIGSWLMHAGRDLAAPEGTPVVAALSGKVVSSGLAGGYGLAVEIEHERPRRRTLYGHLSELYVKEGETVRQGEVIGRVGSTGLSTGPHLHFELRLPQEGGWVATDPGEFDPGGTLIAVDGKTVAGSPSAAVGPDAVALLMGQLLQTLERPRSPLPLPGEKPGQALPPPAKDAPRAG